MRTNTPIIHKATALVHKTAAPVVARLTITRKNGKSTIVEVQADATFHTFFHFYTQDGRRRSTKTLVRKANRNLYLPVINSHRYQPGLDVIEKQLKTLFTQSNPVVASKLRIVKKRVYQKLINAAPDVLGLVKDSAVHPAPITRFALPLLRSPKAIPVDKWLADLKLKQAQVTQ